jgi:tRNA G18 (ribose-2'-O)-methylase SpoU
MQRHSSAVLILSDIRSAHNVGSLFRTADAAGIEKIYLSQTTPAPVDRFGRARSDIAKTALGSEKTILYETVKSIASLITRLQKDGYTVVAIEQDARSVDYKKVKRTEKMAFILGNEVTGVAKSLLSRVDIVADIPMGGMKESLNVSVAGGVALFRILDK